MPSDEEIEDKFRSAAHTVLPFGKHRGRKLDDIAKTDEGLLYLDWLLGERSGQGDSLTRALAAYLNHPTMVKEVSAALKAQKGD